MLLYSNLNSKNFCEKWFRDLFYFLLLEGCTENFTEKVLRNCNLFLQKKCLRSDILFNPLFPRVLSPTQDHWIVLPRTEQAFDELVLIWHENLDNFCTSRNYYLTEEQQAVFDEERAIGFSEMFRNIFEKEATNLRVKARELDVKFKKLEPDDTDKVYVDKFLRGIKPEVARIDSGFYLTRSQPNIFIDLIFPSSKVITNSLNVSYWAIQSKRNKLFLKHTSKPHKHDKSLVYL